MGKKELILYKYLVSLRLVEKEEEKCGLLGEVENFVLFREECRSRGGAIWKVEMWLF